MREPQKSTIDGVIFEVTPLGFRKGRAVFMRVSKAVGPSLALVAERPGSRLSALPLAEIVTRALEAVSDDDLEWLADVLGETTRFSTDGGVKLPYLTGPNREQLFAGRISLFFRWIWFALEVNFADFFDFLPARPDAGPAGATPPA